MKNSRGNEKILTEGSYSRIIFTYRRLLARLLSLITRLIMIYRQPRREFSIDTETSHIQQVKTGFVSFTFSCVSSLRSALFGRFLLVDPAGRPIRMLLKLQVEATQPILARLDPGSVPGHDLFALVYESHFGGSENARTTSATASSVQQRSRVDEHQQMRNERQGERREQSDDVHRSNLVARPAGQFKEGSSWRCLALGGLSGPSPTSRPGTTLSRRIKCSCPLRTSTCKYSHARVTREDPEVAGCSTTERRTLKNPSTLYTEMCLAFVTIFV